MASSEISEILVVWGSLILVFLALFLIVFIILLKRRLHAKEGIIERQRQNIDVELNELKKEIAELRDEIRTDK
ncbi:MAG: hypothetical protein QNK23_12265 [Crocinitomicaceae bacterium]|nr:hypothetical protein [Crocinitomicaceae bacterium]